MLKMVLERVYVSILVGCFDAQRAAMPLRIKTHDQDSDITQRLGIDQPGAYSTARQALCILRVPLLLLLLAGLLLQAGWLAHRQGFLLQLQ
jgi:hypothetical protein